MLLIFIVSKFATYSNNKSKDDSYVTESEVDLEKELIKLRNRGNILSNEDHGKLLKEIGKS